jgi:transposase-like protein
MRSKVSSSEIDDTIAAIEGEWVGVELIMCHRGGVSDLHFGSQICHIASLVKEVMMVLIPVFCPHCQSDQVIKGGKTQVSKQRYKCQNAACPHYSFQLDLTYKGRSPEIKDRIIEMALNGSGIRDTARVLKISPTTVINELKKKRRRSAV